MSRGGGGGGGQPKLMTLTEANSCICERHGMSARGGLISSNNNIKSKHSPRCAMQPRLNCRHTSCSSASCSLVSVTMFYLCVRPTYLHQAPKGDHNPGRAASAHSIHTMHDIASHMSRVAQASRSVCEASSSSASEPAAPVSYSKPCRQAGGLAGADALSLAYIR